MRIDTICGLWQEQNPTGSIDYAKREGFFSVCYASTGKAYEYRASSVFALAERLDLVPEVDMQVEAQRIVDALLSGADSVSGDAGASDTCRWLVQDNERTVDCKYGKADEFGRAQAEYFLADRNTEGW